MIEKSFTYPKRVLFIFFIGIIIFLISCKSETKKSSESNNIAVAEVGEKKLYLYEIENILGKNMTKEDSFLLIKSFVDNWVQKQVLLLNAEKFEFDNTEEINKKIEEYKEDLILYEYQKKILNENIDTLISIDEAMNYYKENPQNFELKQNIIRFVFIKVKKTDEKKYNLWSKFSKSKPEDLTKLAIFAVKNGGNANIEYDKWTSFDDVIKAVPINTYNQENFLNNNRIFKTEDEKFYWFINILDFKIKDDISPFEFVQDKINEIIINKRKTVLLNKFENQLIEKAKKDKIVKINLKQYN
ncbi:MAG: hypothetical protein IT243_05925 [Bacteroidia bacterium]|nr:hypothetical protein [Bacteroidia bacterium]